MKTVNLIPKSSMKPIQLFIVDDHSLVIAGISNLLEANSAFEITGEFLTGKSLLEALEDKQPDILLLDILLPDINGKELALIIKNRYPEVRIIAITSLDAPMHVKAMMRNGCDGYLLKNTDQETLWEAIKTVHGGEQYIDKNLEKQMLNSFLNFKKVQQQQERTRQNTKLTKREKEILSLIVKENSNQEIADMLYLSVRTVEFHRQNLQLKLDVKTPIGLLKAAIELGLI